MATGLIAGSFSFLKKRVGTIFKFNNVKKRVVLSNDFNIVKDG